MKSKLEALGYEISHADPCVFYLFQEQEPLEIDDNKLNKNLETRTLSGIIGVATDDLLHGGGDRHWEKMRWLQQNYKMGKFSSGNRRFIGKEIEVNEDYSFKIHQRQYTEEKVKIIEIPKTRSKRRYDDCTPEEITQMRGLLGIMSWLAKETRPDLQGRVALLQQTMPRPIIDNLMDLNNLAKEAQARAEVGIKIQPIPMEKLRIGVVSDASWGNVPGGMLETNDQDFWEEQEEIWIRHHRQPRRLMFHPKAAPDGPSLHEITDKRQTFVDEQEIIRDTWNKKGDFRSHGQENWTGKTIFFKTEEKSETARNINETFLQTGRVNSQGGYICFAYNENLETDTGLQMISPLSWKSYKLKRCTVNMLSAEAQSMIQGVGEIHWMRLLLAEVRGHQLQEMRWEKLVAKLPFVAVTDSKSLFDTLSKITNAASQVSDKRTAIDLTILKSDLQATLGTVRWVEGVNMICDCLTKRMSGAFLRFLLKEGHWTLCNLGSQILQQKYAEEKRHFNQLE